MVFRRNQTNKFSSQFKSRCQAACWNDDDHNNGNVNYVIQSIQSTILARLVQPKVATSFTLHSLQLD